ncbi:ras-related protein Rab-38-like [Ruditapes philippinarum]|uniref:ras-related protein Rab-38-like n=1 Tax=Ruditapes philippinarum TaxID=129788 RepID=UPI00295BB992|nr:ras-related protein Rab-38-like [Ruditapes philippinarum]
MIIKMAATNKFSSTREHLFKVLVIGEFGVGKTSIIRRYVDGHFNPNYKLTIGVDFALKSIEWDTDTKVNLQLWDIAGHERFGHMTRVYYKYAIAAIIVFDLSRPATFDSIPKWLNDVNSKVMLSNEDPVPVILLANKCDVEDVTIDEKKISDFCQAHNIVKWYQTSAKDNVNIDEAMKLLIDYILKLPAENQQPEEHITLPSRRHSNTNPGNTYEESFEEDDTGRQKQSQCCS